VPFVKKKFFVKERQKAVLFLINELGYTQRESQRFISKGRVLVDGEKMLKTSGEIEGDIEFIFFEPITKGLVPTFIHDQFVVFDKPSGVLIHPKTKATPYSLIDELKHQYGKDANIAHRIDQETSGLVLCAINKSSEREIKMMFQDRNMKKKYLALVHGKFDSYIKVNEPLLREQDDSTYVRMLVKVDATGKESMTEFFPLEYYEDLDMSLVECIPHTGRQHQIRVHLFHVKHPIVGDPIYGQSKKNLERYLDKKLSGSDRINLSGASRLMLHANELLFQLHGDEFHVVSKVDFRNQMMNYLK